MAAQPFEERQAFHWIIYAGLLLTLGGMFAAVLTASAVNGESLDPGQRWSTLAWIVFPCLIAVNVLFMRTRVDGHELVVSSATVSPYTGSESRCRRSGGPAWWNTAPSATRAAGASVSAASSRNDAASSTAGENAASCWKPPASGALSGHSSPNGSSPR